jgi:hypothetical protein
MLYRLVHLDGSEVDRLDAQKPHSVIVSQVSGFHLEGFF